MPPRTKISNMIPCSKEAEIAEIKTTVNDLKLMIKGNGKKGMHDELIEIKGALPGIREAIVTLSDNVRELLDNKIASDTKERTKMSARERLTAIIMGIIGATTVGVMVAEMVIKSRG
jgi:hypothetical protein